MITCMSDVVGKYAMDSEGNALPMRKETVGMYVAHTGTQIWLRATFYGAGESDAVQFGHLHNNVAWFNKEYAGRMVKVVSTLNYDYRIGMWCWYNEVYSA